MPLTEKEQIHQEIGEIIDARSERRKLTIDTSRLSGANPYPSTPSGFVSIRVLRCMTVRWSVFR